jgi:hypothetical protein
LSLLYNGSSVLLSAANIFVSCLNLINKLWHERSIYKPITGPQTSDSMAWMLDSYMYMKCISAASPQKF